MKMHEAAALSSAGPKIYQLLKKASLEKQSALSTGYASNVLRDAGINMKKNYGVTKLSDALVLIDGIEIHPAKYHGGAATVVITALAQVDAKYASSEMVENSAGKRGHYSSKGGYPSLFDE